MEVAPIRLYGSANSSGMNAEFQQRLANLFSAAPAEYRSHLGIYSGFRDQAKQDRLFAAAVKKYGSEGAARKWVAKKSEHTAGYAADVGWDGAGLKGAPPAAIKWLHDNAGNYGLHFPLSNENWHIEPVEARPGGKPIYNAALKAYPGLAPIAGHPVPPLDIPTAPQPMVRPASLSVPSAVPMPRSRPNASSLPALPSAAMYGVNRLVPGQKTAAPTDFTTADVGAPDLRALGMTGAMPNPTPSYGQPPVTQAQTMAEQRMGRAIPPQIGAIPPVPMPGRPSALQSAAAAPMPMPGRPAGLQTTYAPPVPMPGRPMAPPVIAQAPTVPPPIQRTAMVPPQAMAAMQRPAAPQQQLVRLASGQMIPVGIQQGSNGPVNITDDGRGNAVVSKIRNPGSIPGLIDPIKEAGSDTLAGGFIRSKIPEVMGNAVQGVQQNLGYAGDAIKSNAAQAVNNLGQGAQNVAGTIGNAFGSLGSLFGGHPASPTWSGMRQSVLRPQSGGVPPIPQSRPMFAPPQQQQSAAAYAPQRDTGQAGGTIYQNSQKYGATQADRQAAAAQRAAFLAQWGG